MAKLSFNKAALHKENAKLKRYRQYLPSLDLKRQKLLEERAKASGQLAQTEQSMQQCRRFVAENLPMLADASIELHGMVKISAVNIGREKVIGNQLPVLDHLEIIVKPYATFDQPHWVDAAVLQLKRMLELQMQWQVDTRRLEILHGAVIKITQRINLFEKVLIPRTQQNINKISIFLSDMNRAAVVRAKITKQKRLQGAGKWLLLR